MHALPLKESTLFFTPQKSVNILRAWWIRSVLLVIQKGLPLHNITGTFKIRWFTIASHMVDDILSLFLLSSPWQLKLGYNLQKNIIFSLNLKTEALAGEKKRKLNWNFEWKEKSLYGILLFQASTVFFFVDISNSFFCKLILIIIKKSEKGKHLVLLFTNFLFLGEINFWIWSQEQC